jgi:hypothetical protein
VFVLFCCRLFNDALSNTHTLSLSLPLSLYISVCVCVCVFVVELGYDVGKGIEYSVSLLTSVLTAEHNIVVKSEEFISATECHVRDGVSHKPMSF